LSWATTPNTRSKIHCDSGAGANSATVLLRAVGARWVAVATPFASGRASPNAIARSHSSAVKHFSISTKGARTRS
jgi:hypothetical protein